jgi:HPt (histidine-containing phosphotransfer) domain-containing protein
MGSIKRRPRNPLAAAPGGVDQDDSFESLRRAFRARLESERVHFATLSAALARADENPRWIFEDLIYRAHRLQGGAAIFQESQIAVAAGRLENAAGAAVQSRAENTDDDVWSALEALVKVMGHIETVQAVGHA